MTTVQAITVEVTNADEAQAFYESAFGLDERVQVVKGESESTGFRGFTLSFTVAQPSEADSFLDSAARAGASILKPAGKSLWGYGGTLQAPDGTVITVASKSKRDTSPVVRKITGLVLQLSVSDVRRSRDFYVSQGFELEQSFGKRYAEFGPDSSPVSLALLTRGALAKAAGCSSEGAGSHRVTVITDGVDATDPDGFVLGSIRH